ncbi:mRNA export factor MEX67 [Tolypocladium capitatum]|uniref:mRNA export factor MEX67 n=1 Tax=Tolypocladium capitatum TaxID=45235 RepID=A0A2K3QLG5_9HYPO|nr:mRNA export factor MEX67 [Tolypocladium capitatum]
MAPRGSRASNLGRGARNSAGRAKPSWRGGIQKRRDTSKVDGDGDLDMDASGKRGSQTTTAGLRSRPAPRSSVPRNPRGVSNTAQTVLKHLKGGDSSHLASRISDAAAGKPTRGRGKAGLSYLRVHGLRQSKAASNPDGGLKDLLNFLERKASSLNAARPTRQIMIRKSHVVGDYVFIGASKADAEELIKLNTFMFAGTQLEVVESDEDLGHHNKATESKETQELRAKLQAILSQRYIGANKLLKLDALAADAELVTLGMFENRERALKTFKGLMAICDGLFKTEAAKKDAIESISLASNSIDDVAQVESVATTFPQLKNLDMSGNQIGNMQAMELWRGKFKDLETIYTTGNPIEAADPNFHATLLRWFPRLQDINGVQVRTAEQAAQQAAEKAAASKPKPIPQSGPDFRDVNGIGENFLLEFFTSFDNDRQDLASRLYDDGSQFSLAVDTRSVRDLNAPAPLPWSAYIKVSRNLIKITHQNARMQRLFKGASVIHELWRSLPLTKHPNIKEDLSKYIMDCHPLPGLADPNGQDQNGVDGLIVSVHGEFEEYDQKTGVRGKRSFSRTFVLGPGQAGRGPIRVVSDMLSLRAYSPLPNVFASPAVEAPTPNAQHQAMIAELSKQTGMVPEYSEMCLSQVEWQFDKALIIFNEKKAALPPEAFAPVAQ